MFVLLKPSSSFQILIISLYVTTRRPGCECAEAYYGPHCEFLKRDKKPEEPDLTGHDDEDTGNPELNPVDGSNDNSASTGSSSAKSGLSPGAAIGIILAAIVTAVAVAIFLRRRYLQKARSIEESIRLEEETDQFVMPAPNTKTRRYRDFLGNPDIPDMDSPIRPTTSYHDHVF